MKQHNGVALEMQALPDAIHSHQKDQVIVRGWSEFTSTALIMQLLNKNRQDRYPAYFYVFISIHRRMRFWWKC